MISRRNLAFAPALVLALAVLPLPALAAESDAPKPGIVSVTGEGTARLAPDMAVLTLTVMRQEKTAREALDANNSAMAAVLASMRSDGVEERDLQTSGFTIDPQYFYPDRKDNEPAQPVITGYRVMNTLTVRIRDLDNLGTILDKSVDLGVNQGGQILFTNDDPSAAITEARTQAMKDAVSKATTLVEAAGATLGRITDISEQQFRPQPLPVARAERALQATADAAVPVATGENAYKVNVNVSFEIDQ
ncbi:SIMPL domain-containing protein [Nitratireductor sp. XY-223]|uniref:SIMPL domain-containing protein n=1 Tax=Nitratireductor sp. XY-223 TaxID=2561926 RepID=UPI0010AB1D2B|nr:SIMPL domain-containing protein [Nitratireductor sp. XY-223]